ncbi:MAG TPA: dUTP diphosphatase [Candidatus Doudnabacteria bacterium]|nr:dUTP diphosphatase [Candidatus Doudnabacteria bacterium]
MNISKLAFKKLNEHAILPTRGSSLAAGLDLYASVDQIIPARSFATVSTGISTAIPENYYGRIAPRSGLAAKSGIDTLAGVVDADYRGEILIVLANHSDLDFTVKAGDRIAQFIIESIIIPEPEFVHELEETHRGKSGFGSTGK